jgi:hypothetical protein
MSTRTRRIRCQHRLAAFDDPDCRRGTEVSLPGLLGDHAGALQIQGRVKPFDDVDVRAVCLAAAILALKSMAPAPNRVTHCQPRLPMLCAFGRATPSKYVWGQDDRR